MSARYVYAIIPTRNRVVFDVSGVDTESEVFAVPYGDFAAVISASPLENYQGLKRDAAVSYLVAHQRVVEAVMGDFPVLPLKFGTVLPEETCVTRLLTQGEPLFRTALEQVAGRLQMEVVVLWNLQEVFQEISQEESIVQLKTQLAGLSPEELEAERIVLGQMVHTILLRRRADLSDHLLPSLREVALDSVVNPPMDDSMVLNVALLVEESGCESLDRQLETLDKQFDGQLTFRCIGPLPPYSFATVELEFPIFAEVDQARRELGLGGRVTRSEIKHAYHQLASQLHPDHNHGDSEAEARMTRLTKAYRLVTAYADSLPANNGGLSPNIFSPEAVEQTMILNIRRQEDLV